MDEKYTFINAYILGANKGRSDDGLTPAQRNERDKKRLEEKAAKKAAQKEAQAKN